MQQQVEAFLENCKESGNAAYAQFKEVLGKLEEPTTRSDARRFLAAVEKKMNEECQGDDALEKYHFRIHQLVLGDGDENANNGYSHCRQTLTLLEMSSIFVPENWSFTFYEGLCRHSDPGFQDRSITELGCGNGWISIAMADRWAPGKVYGLDINPRAIKVAWINLYLNALKPDGTVIIDGEGKSLLDRVEFHVSDLLEYIKERKILLDRVVGCIPQVLSPDPAETLQIVSETMSEEFLHSLSNYCGLQGFVEDQFGLGLIARAVEEAIEVIKPAGALILNMGGRPGLAVCERLFLRRGFHIQPLWHTRVNQAADTDIQALVEIEGSSRHRFEFFMGPVGEEPISARTAYAYAKEGGVIAHGLTVFECRLQQPVYVKDIFRFLSQPGYEETRSALDLSFSNQAVGDEKIVFLAQLSHALQSQKHFSGEQPAGNEKFRTQIASFFRLYFWIPLSVKNLVIVPSRAVAIDAILRLYSPKLALVDSYLTRYLPRSWISTVPSKTGIVVLEAPRRTDNVLRLARSVKPQIMILRLADFEMKTSMAFEQLLETSKEIGSRLFLDISDHLELSSRPTTNGVLQYLAENRLPSHAAIICGLVKNQVYSDLEVAFVLSENRTFLQDFAYGGELTYSRTPSMPQLYYGSLLNDLLSFQIRDKHVLAERSPMEEDSSFTERFGGPTVHAVTAFQHPSISASHILRVNKKTVVIMDYSENSLPCPASVKQFLFEGFGRQHVSEAEMDPRPEIAQRLSKQFGIDGKGIHEVFMSVGSASLFSCLMAACCEESGTLLHPTAFSGRFLAMAQYCGVEAKAVSTDLKNGFKMTPDQLKSAIVGVSQPWLVLSAPLVNPSGAIYSNSEFSQLLEVCRENNIRVIIESSYTGLEFQHDSEKLELGKYFIREEGSSYSLAIIGGISKELSAGGLGFGFAAVNSVYFAEILQQMAPGSRPHGTLRYASKKILALLNQAKNPLIDALSERRAIFQQRATVLAEVLSKNGWEPIIPSGGLCLLARPVNFEGKTITYSLFKADRSDGQEVVSKTVELNSESIAEALFHVVGVTVNSSGWTGVPGFCRFVFAIDEQEFDVGLKRLQEFYKFVFGN